ncbi:MAG: biotin--[Lachnospiraceae bacterium]|nr:biotin--[acetyl-CoA-carboxylase] ligase [Lachnospiraceae bacterium]
MKLAITKTLWLGKEIYIFDSIDSTNQKAKELAYQNAPHGILVVADTQSQGRGRRGRSWSSKAGEGIYMSLLLKPNLAPDKASMLTLVTALAVSKGIEVFIGKQKAQIKWPNDIVINGKKICGILTEMELEQGNIHHIVIGIGINVHNKAFSNEIVNVAGSIKTETGMDISRENLIEEILINFEKYYELFLKTRDMCLLLQEYEALLVNKNQKVKVLDPLEEYEGIALGITNMGELLVDTGMEKRTVFAGEVSVRGIYGYV